MPALETVKKVAERLTGWARPSGTALAELLRERKANTFHFKDDGIIPNHPRWPLIIYRGPVRLPKDLDPAAVFEELLQEKWLEAILAKRDLRLRALSFPHSRGARYRPRLHQGAVRWQAWTQSRSRAGDVAILPAGTGHQAISATPDLLVVGAYPPSGTYDLCTSSEDHARAVKTVPKVGRPRNDPVYGHLGPLLGLWPSLRK